MEPNECQKSKPAHETHHGNSPQEIGAAEGVSSTEKSGEQEDGERVKDTARVDAAIKYLYAVARGETPFAPEAGNHMFRNGTYSHEALIYLESLLQMSRKEIVAQALCHFIRSLTFRQITTQNDIGVAIHGLQFSIQDLALEAQAFNELMIQAIDQEACKADPGQPMYSPCKP